MCNIDLIKLCEQAIEIKNGKVEIEEADKGQSFMGEINFIKITKPDISKQNQIEYIIAKVSKSDRVLRDKTENISKRECCFYDQIVPIFTSFQKNKNIKCPFNSLPKCYKVISLENKEIILLENLQKVGYELRPKQVPLNNNHIRFVLREYAKFHAVSLALQDQRKEYFEYIEIAYSAPYLLYHLYRDDFIFGVKDVINQLNKYGREDLAVKYENLMKDGPTEIAEKVSKNVPAIRVVTHGDCHIHNILFKYEDDKKDSPTGIALIDFQLSYIHSPITDISYFLYFVSSAEDVSRFDEFLDYYYQEISLAVAELGSDIKTLFPKSEVKEHWRKYSFFGFLQASCFLKLFHAEEGAVPDPSSNPDIKDFFDVKIKYPEEYRERFLAIIEHYFSI